MKEEIKQRMMQQIELALLKLNHVPYIVSKKQKMAVWSDIREILFMKCVGQKCSVVLSALKSHLRYPASERFMHPCSPSEQLQFMKKYMVVSPGTLLVDLNSIGDRFELMKLYDMVKIKHDMSGDETIRKCKEVSERRKNDRNIQHLLENPLRNLTKKIFLPSIQRSNNKAHREERDGRLIQSVLYNSFGEEASAALIPMYLLKETYPASICVLEEAVRLYIIGQSGQANLASVSQCTREEGYHFSRFMAMQFGFEKQWPCFTSCSLLISWEEFWLSNVKNKDVNLVPNINVSVVTLNCQSKDRFDQNCVPFSSRANSKVLPHSTAPNIKGKQINEDRPDKLKQSSTSNQTVSASQTSKTKKETKINLETKLIPLVHERSRSKLPQSVQASIKKSKSYTSSVTKQGRNKTRSPRKCHSNNILPEIGEAKFLSSMKDSRDDNTEVPAQSKAQVDKRVTRSKSHNAVFTSNNLVSTKQEQNDLKMNGNFLRKSSLKYQRKDEGADPDENNSAVHDVQNKKKTLETTPEKPVEQVQKKNESLQNLTISQESISDGQTAFDIGSIEVSITHKRRQGEEEKNTDLDENQLQVQEGSGRKSPFKRFTERKNLKIPYAKFSDKIPDLLRVGKKNETVDQISLNNKQKVSPKESSGHQKQALSLEETVGYNLKEKKKSQNCAENRTREDKVLTKSIELNVISPKQKIKGKEFHTQKFVKHAKKKETNIVEDSYPMINGIKLQNSPTKSTDRSTCKSAGTLPGPVNTIPNKAKSASLERTGKLPNEIVSNLKQQATNSICSVLGNSDENSLKGIIASGKEIISPRKTSAVSSDFQSERITMWRDTLEENSSSPKSGRTCKSADVFNRRERPYSYRPSSSIYYPSYSDQKEGNGPSIKTGLCVLMSRERSKSPKASFIKNTYQMPKRKSSPKKGRESKTGTIDEVDIPNFGSSSSKTPDIYDEFARKKKPRGSKPDLQLVKGKQMACEQKYGQTLQSYKAKNYESKAKPSENTHNRASTQLNYVNQRVFGQNTTKETDSSHNGVVFHQFQNNAYNETRNLPLTTNMYRILDANLTKRNNVYQYSQGQMENACNSNQYTTCSMCWHESNIADDTDYVGLSLSNLNTTNLKPMSSFNDIPTEESKVSGSFKERNEVSCTERDPYHRLCESKESLLERIKSIEDNASAQGQNDIVICAPEMEPDLVDIGAHDENKNIKLLDKMNMFVEGICVPQQSDSLENIENIKNIIKINPIQSQNQLSLGLNRNERLCKSLGNFVQNGFTTPWEVLNYNVAKIEDETTQSLSSDNVDDQFTITTNQLETCNSIEAVNVQEPDSDERCCRNENDNVEKTDKNHVFDQDDINETEVNTETQKEKCTVSENLVSREKNCNKGMIDSYSIIHNRRTLPEDFENVPGEVSDHSKDRTTNKIVKTKDCKKQRKNKARGKSFKEVVEEKRASKKKTELELAKKKFWKSANPNADNESQDSISHQKQKKKTIIKTLSEDNTGVQMAQNSPDKTLKKKRPKTCPIYSTKTCQSEHFHKHVSQSDISKGTQRSTRKNTEYCETDGQNFVNSKKLNKELNKGEACISSGNTEEKSIHARNLRTRSTKSAKNNNSFKKNKRNSLKNSTDVYRNINDDKNNINKEEPHKSRKFQARQKKLRLKVHNECSPQGAKTCKQKVDNANIQPSESGLEQVDDSKIICETVQFENIVEVDDIQADGIEYSPTKTFITQSNEHPFELEMNSLNLDNSLPFEEIPSLNHLQSLEMHTKGNNKNVYEGLYTDMLPESAHSRQNTEYLSLKKDSLLSIENANVDENGNDWNYFHETSGVKNVDLSELPESVLEVVLSDNLINMTSYLSPYLTEGEEGMTVMNKEEDASMVLQNNISTTRNTELYVESAYVPLHGDLYSDHLSESNRESNRETCYVAEEPVNQFNELNICDHQQIDENVDSCTDDMSQNAITVLHPNGGKIYLTANHPAYQMFSNVFVQQDLNPSVEDGNNLTAQPNQRTENLQSTALINENEIQGDRSIDNNEIVESTCGQNCENEVSKAENQYTDRSPNKVAITTDKLRKCFYNLSMIKSEPKLQKSSMHTHSENIFDTLQLELDKMTQRNGSNLSHSLMEEINNEDRNIEKSENDGADFEKDIMALMGEGLERKLSGFESDEPLITSNGFHQIYSTSNEISNQEGLSHSNSFNQNEKGSFYGNNCPIKECSVVLSTDVNLCQQDKSAEDTEQASVLGVDSLVLCYDNNRMPIPPEAQPTQDTVRSIALGLRENKTDKHKDIKGSGVDQQSDTSNCESPETCKYGDDSFSDLSCSDFVPDYSDETTDDIYDSNSDNSEFGRESSTEHRKICSTVGKLSIGKNRPKKGQKKTYLLKDKSNTSKSLENKEQVKSKCKRGRKRNLRRKKNAVTNEDENDEGSGGCEDTVSVNSLVTTQKLYLDILKNSTGKKDEEMAETDCRYTENLEDILSEGFTLKRDRDLSRLEAEAERMKEGTGSLADLEREDTDETIVNDPTTNCRALLSWDMASGLYIRHLAESVYQVVEDEDGITLGGVVYYNEYVLPFVYINGYKYTPLKDAATLFQPDCCAWKCRIPKNVMMKDKRLFKTFSTWEQVYKLELIKMKKGPPVKTGDVLVKFDSFVSLLPNLLLEIIEQHKHSKLKTSQDCDIKSYLALQGKFK